MQNKRSSIFPKWEVYGALKKYVAIPKNSIDYNDKMGDRIFVMRDLVSAEEANWAEGLLQQLMFPYMPLYRVSNLC